MTRKEVQAQFLKVGQTLATGEKVTQSATRGYGTPRGKVELHINGYLKVWNARTLITVVMNEPASV